MAYSKASLIQDIRHLLQDEPWETTSTTTTTATTVAVPDGTKWAAGDVGEWQTGTVGGEQFLVQSVSGNNLTVARGYNGTTAEAHTSGDRVVKNPTYQYIQIVESISRVIQSLFPSVWKSVSASVTPNTTSRWFDSGLTGQDVTDVIDLAGAEQVYDTTKVGVYGARRGMGIPSRPILMEFNLPTSIVSSGIGLSFPGGFFHASNTVTVRYRVKLADTVSGGNYSDLTEGVLTEAITQLAIARLLQAKEIPNLSEDQRVGQAQVGAYVGTAGVWELKGRELLAQYRAELERKYPPIPDQHYVPGWW